MPRAQWRCDADSRLCALRNAGPEPSQQSDSSATVPDAPVPRVARRERTDLVDVTTALHELAPVFSRGLTLELSCDRRRVGLAARPMIDNTASRPGPHAAGRQLERLVRPQLAAVKYISGGVMEQAENRMAMVKCRECGKDVSDEAKNCPHCGIAKPAPPSKVGNYIKLALGAVLLISIFRCIGDQEDRKSQADAERARAEAAKTPEQRAQEAAKKAKDEAEFQSVVARLKALKASTKNPASFELVEALLMDDGTVCVVYRGTNSFNAVVTENKAISTDARVVDWNRYCGGKSGKDMKFARQAL